MVKGNEGNVSPDVAKCCGGPNLSSLSLFTNVALFLLPDFLGGDPICRRIMLIVRTRCTHCGLDAGIKAADIRRYGAVVLQNISLRESVQGSCVDIHNILAII